MKYAATAGYHLCECLYYFRLYSVSNASIIEAIIQISGMKEFFGLNALMQTK